MLPGSGGSRCGRSSRRSSRGSRRRSRGGVAAQRNNSSLTLLDKLLHARCCALLRHHQVRFVRGLDLSDREVAEARRRYEEMLERDRGEPASVSQQA